MLWGIISNVLLYVGAIVLYFTGFGWWALACFVVAFLLSLILSSGRVDLSDIFFFLD